MDKKPSENKEGKNIEETLPNTRNRNEDGNLDQALPSSRNNKEIYQNIYENPNDIMVGLRKNKENGLKEVFLCEKIEDKLLITKFYVYKLLNHINYTKIGRELIDKENEKKENDNEHHVFAENIKRFYEKQPQGSQTNF